MSALNENQKRRLWIGLQQVDQSLAEAWSVLSVAEAASPFTKYVADASPAQIRVLQDYIARFRSASTRILDEIGIPRPPPRVGARWSFHAALVAARVILDEMDPGYLRGYGPLSQEDEVLVRRAVLEIQDLIRKMSAVVDARTDDP